MRIDRKSDGEFIPQRSETARERLDATHVPMFLLGCARWSLRQGQFQRGTIEAFTFKAVWERREHEPGFVLIPIEMGLGVPSMTTTILSSVDRYWSGTASAVLNAARQAGGAAGVAVLGPLASGETHEQIVSGLQTAGVCSSLLGSRRSGPASPIRLACIRSSGSSGSNV